MEMDLLPFLVFLMVLVVRGGLIVVVAKGEVEVEGTLWRVGGARAVGLEQGELCSAGDRAKPGDLLMEGKVAVEEGRLQWGRQLKCAKNEAGQVKEGSYEAVEKRVGPGWVQGGEEKVGEQTGNVQRRRGWAGETGEGGDGGLAVAVQ
ncbi:hypothetical protein MRB53_028606 [Persea americana]|uniref:Uncharacterized protein n=1 Tax=Persea americana TaxID=3435 RepID=A0ACC2KGD6_PERAE|nr:hypothetical protein MRB53_028606 [Persea americana]